MICHLKWKTEPFKNICTNEACGVLVSTRKALCKRYRGVDASRSFSVPERHLKKHILWKTQGASNACGKRNDPMKCQRVCFVFLFLFVFLFSVFFFSGGLFIFFWVEGVISGLSLLFVLVLPSWIFFPGPSIFRLPQIWKQLTDSHSVELLLLNTNYLSISLLFFLVSCCRTIIWIASGGNERIAN